MNIEKGKSEIKWFIFMILAAILIFVFFKYGGQFRHIKFHTLANYIKSYGRFSAFVFIIIYTFKPVLFVVPSSIMSIIAGFIYGPYIALILNMVGCFGSATVAFFIAKAFGKSFVDRIIKGKVIKLDDNIEKHGFKIMLVMRLSFIFPFDGLSFASGLTKIKYRDFIFGTLLGILPEMAAYSFMGHNMMRPFSIKFFLPIILLALIVVIVISVKQKVKDIQ